MCRFCSFLNVLISQYSASCVFSQILPLLFTRARVFIFAFHKQSVNKLPPHVFGDAVSFPYSTRLIMYRYFLKIKSSFLLSLPQFLTFRPLTAMHHIALHCVWPFNGFHMTVETTVQFLGRFLYLPLFFSTDKIEFYFCLALPIRGI